MRYRKDAQVLRGVAVLLVVLFHLGSGAFKSGFLGVDVFFVISGYLMAVMYTPADKAGFFTKRARRLLPAYFVTVLGTLLAAAVVTTPLDFAQVVNQSWFATLFASNIGFWSENSYFDKAVFKPLLHLWSLGVEIQFYLLVPALYWFLKKMRAPGYWVLVLGSMVSCFFMVGVSHKTSFFWLPFRLWEFLFGFGVASFLATRSVPRAAWAGAAGLAMILLIPVLPVSGTASNAVFGHPGLLAATICVATVAVLMFGLPTPLLNSKMAGVLEHLGNWSYSIYLAHFPAIVLVLYQPFAGTVLQAESFGQLALVMAMVVVASTLLYRYVEAPLRHGPVRASWVAGAVAAVLALGAFVGVLQDLTVPAAEKPIYAAWQDRAPYRCGKIARVVSPRTTSCEITPPMDSPSLRILLTGNSHADSIKVTFAQAAAAYDATVFFTVDNTPLPPRVVMKEALARRVDTIVVHNSRSSVDAKAIAELAALAAASSVRVVFIQPVPLWPQHIPMAMWRHAKRGLPPPVQTLAEYQAGMAPLQHQLAAIKADNLRMYEVAPVLCPDTCLVVNEDGKLLYFDQSHLTLTGSALLRPLFDTIMGDLVRDLAAKRPPVKQPNG
jgi:peptidoglycan/LPS O-acetylase OafA/YrhL